MIGEVASHYRVLERLGGGGMGEVYLAEDLRLHRPVALKMLRPGVHRDPQARARLLREAQAASALNHPNIAVIHEIDEIDRGEGPVSFIVMEYVAGRTLAQLAAEAALDLDGILAVVGQIADALAEAHACGIVHRDVKPSNIMVTDSGRVKIVDFGLAKHSPFADDTASTWSRAGGKLSGAGALVGTVAYMSPEQALGKEIDARSDIFSLGVVCYELLAGRLPFAGDTAVAILDGILREEPPPLAPRWSDPRAADLERVVRRMLAKDRSRRYPSLREVRADLAAIERGAPPPAAQPVPASLAPAVAVMSFSNITRNGEDDWVGTGITETVTADLRTVGGLDVLARDRVQHLLRSLGAAGEPDELLAVRVGRELGARWVLGGGFQRLGDVVRVTARLIDVETGVLARTLKIDGRMSEIFDVQDRIVKELASDLHVRPAPVAEDTHVLEAYEAFSKGVLNLREESYESLDRAVLLLERAIALDPGYARAYLELGAAYDTKADYLVAPEFYARAIANYRKALELRPDLVRAWRELGSALVSSGREDDGIEAIRHALSLDAQDAGALQAMGRALFIGKAQFREAAEYFERALARNRQAGWAALQLAHCAALLRDLPRGEAAARRAADLQEASLSGHERVIIVGAYMRLGHLASLRGRHAEAVEQFQRELAFVQRVDHALRSRIVIELQMRVGAAQLRLGNAEQARAHLDTALDAFERRIRMGADEPFTRYYAACVYALRGQKDEALSSLEKAAAGRRRFTVERARIEPELEPLRSEPRFRELVG